MNRYRRRRRYPVKPIVVLAVFALLQLGGLRLYHTYGDLVRNVDLTTLRQSYLPALLDAPTAADTPGSGDSRSVPVLVYHGILAQPDGANTTIAEFREQMFGLKRAGYRAVSLAEFQRYLAGGRPLPARSFLLTFDDGRKDSYYPVDPILAALGFHATMFVITEHAYAPDAASSTYYLNGDELLRMRDSGRWDIEAHARHGHTLLAVDAAGKQGHYYSNLAWLADRQRRETTDEYERRIAADLAGARADLERHLGRPVTMFAFPFGDYGQGSVDFPGAQQIVLRLVGGLYRYAFAQEESHSAEYGQNAAGANASTLNRIKVYPGWTAANIAKLIEVGAPKDTTFDDTFTDQRGWATGDGTIELTGSALRLAAVPQGRGAAAYLDGSGGWRDYRFTATVVWPATSGSVTLVARNAAGDNSLGCAVTPKRMQIEQRADGVRQVLAETVLPAGDRHTLTFAVTVHGTAVTCTETGGAQLTADAATASAAGGIGVRLWDQQPGVAGGTVREVHVVPG